MLKIQPTNFLSWFSYFIADEFQDILQPQKFRFWSHLLDNNLQKIKLSFRELLNHSNRMSKAKVMVKSLLANFLSLFSYLVVDNLQGIFWPEKVRFQHYLLDNDLQEIKLSFYQLLNRSNQTSKKNYAKNSASKFLILVFLFGHR